MERETESRYIAGTRAELVGGCSWPPLLWGLGRSSLLARSSLLQLEDLVSAHLHKQESESPCAAPAGVMGMAWEAGGCWEVRPQRHAAGVKIPAPH